MTIYGSSVWIKFIVTKKHGNPKLSYVLVQGMNEMTKEQIDKWQS